MSTIKVDNIQLTTGQSVTPVYTWLNLTMAATFVLNDSLNVSSVTDAGSARAYIYFSNSFTDANYGGGAFCGNHNNTVGIDSDHSANTSGRLNIRTYDVSNTSQDGNPTWIILTH